MEDFDFHHWRSWLETKATDLRSGNVEAVFRCLTGFIALEVDGDKAIGQFCSWHEQSLADFEVLEVSTGETAAQHSMIAVNDKNFENVFDSFWKEFCKVNSCA